jgi:hypothetical protein
LVLNTLNYERINTIKGKSDNLRELK